ncbi:hypothetical protein DUNSADRAFT_12983 [Dunaliella salina]|uniref:Uncharacterized protein n=1 Tax=Dunaliella salina TaxID=3046 RepID=A0ABQ7GAC1_DUNSA|nr:hypothetical protein DUNSADRAFT_12983 [Dunaliella salina]|eukprot:KAF5831537.1 hypothetical protein DUNSADRAFT_12983 [Dunaliella salina]
MMSILIHNILLNRDCLHMSHFVLRSLLACQMGVFPEHLWLLAFMDLYRNIFQISKQQEAKIGSQGLVLMAKHLVSGNLTALKFHKQREARDFSAEVLRGLVSARKVVATIPPDLPASDVIFDDEEKYPDYPYCLVMEGGVEDLVESMAKSGSSPMPENQIR